MMRRWVLMVLVALVLAIGYHAVGAAVFLPRLRSDDPRTVVMAYYDAQRWGYGWLSQQTLCDEQREALRAPNVVRPVIPDALWARNLKVSEPAKIPLYRAYADETQFVVTYDSVWRDGIGNPPGGRFWFVYAGRDGTGRWRVLGQGTGP